MAVPGEEIDINSYLLYVKCSNCFGHQTDKLWYLYQDVPLKLLEKKEWILTVNL